MLELSATDNVYRHGEAKLNFFLNNIHGFNSKREILYNKKINKKSPSQSLPMKIVYKLDPLLLQ